MKLETIINSGDFLNKNQEDDLLRWIDAFEINLKYIKKFNGFDSDYISSTLYSVSKLGQFVLDYNLKIEKKILKEKILGFRDAFLQAEKVLQNPIDSVRSPNRLHRVHDGARHKHLPRRRNERHRIPPSRICKSWFERKTETRYKQDGYSQRLLKIDEAESRRNFVQRSSGNATPNRYFKTTSAFGTRANRYNDAGINAEAKTRHYC